MAELRDITMDQGSTYNPTFILRNSDKSFFNLAGYKARMQVRSSFDADTPVLDLTDTNGKLSITAASGRIQLNIVPADTTSISFEGDSFSGVYDMEVESASGVVTRIAQGAFVINREVTR